MKRILVIGMALAFTLGIAGLSLSAEQGTMKHEDVKICGNAHCCGAEEQAKRSETKKSVTVEPDLHQYKGFAPVFGGG